jgi:methylthioribose-1-phosphate isomerase
MDMLRALEWAGGEDGLLRILDQTLLPATVAWLECRDVESVFGAIRRLSVRGAPAIGIAAAYGVVLGVRGASDPSMALRVTVERLGSARPTAVNLQWALQRMYRAATETDAGPVVGRLLAEARAIHSEDEDLCRRIGTWGAPLVPEGGTVLTHCNAGALATGGMGTALAVLYAAWQAGRRFRVLADETRPLRQGARLTALELSRAGIPVSVVVDSAAAGLLARGEVQMVVVGADRITRNGDVANKVGTYGVALAARAHGVPFFVAAPSSTFDLSLPDGRSIPIEERDASEVLDGPVPPGVGARNPAFDVTPAGLITGLITEHGVIKPPNTATIAAMLQSAAR